MKDHILEIKKCIIRRWQGFYAELELYGHTAVLIGIATHKIYGILWKLTIFRKTNGSLYTIQHIIISMLNVVCVKMAHNDPCVSEERDTETKLTKYNKN